MNFFNKFNKLKNKNFKTNITKILSISIFALLLVISGTSYAYLTYGNKGTLINTVSSGNLELTLANETSTLSLNKAVPQLDDVALEENKEYTFTLKNTGNVLTHYEIYLNSICSIEETYTVNGSNIKPDVCVNDNYVKVGVKEGNNDYTILNFEENKVTLDMGEIWPDEEKNYTVKIWLDVNTPNDYNAYYEGEERNVLFTSKINVIGEQREYRETPEYCFTTNESIITDYNCYSNNSYGYETITNVVIPETIKGVTITTIGSEAFYNNNLTSVKIPNNVTTIGNWAFSSNNLTSVKIPNNVTTIGVAAFNANNLTSLTISSNITSIGNNAFSVNKNLTSIVVDSDNTVYDSRNNSNAIIETSTNTLIQGCKTTVIPNIVTIIGDSAFSVMSLTEITIPNSVTTIEGSAFFGNNLTSITIPNSVTTIGDATFFGNNLTSVILGNNVTTIGNSTFSYNNLTSVTIPNSVTTIGAGAFANNNLTSVKIKGKSSSSDFTSYGSNIWGWASGYSDSNITWNYTE